MDLIDYHRAVMDWTGTHVAALDPADLAAPTRIGWTANELVTHLVGVNVMCRNATYGMGPETLGDPSALAGDDPIGAYQRSSAALTEAFADRGVYDRIVPTPVGPHPGATVLTVGTLENLVHTWDLAADADLDIPEHLVTEALARIASLAALFEQFRALDFYRTAQPVDPDAGPQQRLLAFLGRTP